jgi:hypothetical protein
MDARKWLTSKRLRAHSIILAACLWSFYAWNLATPGLRDRSGHLKGTDFLHFYTLGSLAAAHRGSDLYNINAQASLAAQRVPAAEGLRYLPLYPPQVSLLFAPLSYLSYGSALIVWWAFSAVVYAMCCFAVWRGCPHLRDDGITVFIAALAYPAFFHLIAWGQTSALALACFTGVFFLLRAKRDFTAGLVLGCLIFKPQLGLTAAAVFVLTGAWRTVLGAALSAAAQLGIGVACYGAEPLRQWIRTLSNAQALMPLLEPRPYQTHSLRTFWSMLIPWPGIALGFYVVSAIAVAGLTIYLWKSDCAIPLPVRYSSLLVATALIAPHLTVYDLVIFAPALLLLTDWLVGQSMAGRSRNAVYGRLGFLVYAVYALPLLGFLARWTRVQLSVIAMSAIVHFVWDARRSGQFESQNRELP